METNIQDTEEKPITDVKFFGMSPKTLATALGIIVIGIVAIKILGGDKVQVAQNGGAVL